MRVMQVMAGADRGGAETAFVDTCIAFHEAGIPQLVVTRANDLRVPQLKEAGLEVECLPFGGLIDLYTPYRISQLAAAFKPDIIQTWMARAAWKTPSGKGRYKVVSRLGGYYALKYFKSTDFFTTITPDIAAYLVREGVAPDKVRHINNFAETDTVVTPVFRADLDTPEDALVLLNLGRLHTSKAHDVLIRAAVELPQVHVWIAGEGPLRNELEQLALDLGVDDRVHFLGWRNDRAALLQACDICTFSSRYEPFGTVFVQAWANRTPLICSRADGPRQFVRDGEDGLLFDIDDVSGLVTAIRKYENDAALAPRLVENGYQRYLNEFTKENTVASYLDCYRALLGS